MTLVAAAPTEDRKILDDAVEDRGFQFGPGGPAKMGTVVSPTTKSPSSGKRTGFVVQSGPAKMGTVVSPTTKSPAKLKGFVPKVGTAVNPKTVVQTGKRPVKVFTAPQPTPAKPTNKRFGWWQRQLLNNEKGRLRMKMDMASSSIFKNNQLF